VKLLNVARSTSNKYKIDSDTVGNVSHTQRHSYDHSNIEMINYRFTMRYWLPQVLLKLLNICQQKDKFWKLLQLHM